MNIGTSIFIFHKIQHFVTIYETLLFEVSIFHEQNHYDRFSLNINTSGILSSQATRPPHHIYLFILNYYF